MFDTDAGFRFLKWRAAKRQGRPSAHGKSRPRATEGELNESILRKLDVLDRRRAKERTAGGWQQEEEGNWIPPGWVRAEPPGPG